MVKKYYYYFHLPEEIVMDMLSRLPVKLVLRCSIVCKTWRRIIYSPSFAHMHLQRKLDDEDDHGKLNVFLFVCLKNLGHQFCYALEDENCEATYEKIFKRLDFKPDQPSYYYQIVGSCNGLICISDRSNGESIYICNPITRECLYLPFIINQSTDVYHQIVSGFSYLPSTNEYKVVRICYWHGDNYRQGRVQVYTLGSGTGWREKGRINHTLTSDHSATLANGALHWLDRELRILAFDLADEEFLLLPSPPFLLDHDPELYYRLQVLEGKLCVVHYKNGQNVDVWSLMKNTTVKNGNHDGKVQNKYQFWSWIKEFSIKTDMKDLSPTPITITKRGQVIFYSHGTLSRYDLKTANSEKLVDIEKYYSSAFNSLEEAIPHFNSFISLKALGEEDIKVIETFDGYRSR